MKKLIILIMCIFITGCVTFKQPENRSNYCNFSSIENPSLFCKIAEKHGVDIEKIGKMLKLANIVLIKQNKYTAKESLKVLYDIKMKLEKEITYSDFKDDIRELVIKYPEIFILLSEFEIDLDLNMNISMYQFDRIMITNYLSQMIAELEFITSLKK